MTLVSSLSSSAADVNDKYNNKRLPKGIHIVEADDASDSKVRGMSKNEEEGAPWGYIFIPNRSLEKVSCHFLMTAIRKTALYMLDL